MSFSPETMLPISNSFNHPFIRSLIRSFIHSIKNLIIINGLLHLKLRRLSSHDETDVSARSRSSSGLRKTHA
jgi:hypothetical protein